MANYATQITAPAFDLAGILRRGASAIGRVMVAMSESNARMQAVQRLNEMSDAQLAERGLKREDIVHHVFRDTYYV
jgi:uncharacterized protein YjiS (DUF1127 family)